MFWFLLKVTIYFHDSFDNLNLYSSTLNDLSVIDIISPTNIRNSWPSSLPITIRIRNNGLNQMPSVMGYYQLRGIMIEPYIETFYFTSPLEPDSIRTLTFSLNLNMSWADNISTPSILLQCGILNNDDNVTNNFILQSFNLTRNLLVTRLPYFQGFESCSNDSASSTFRANQVGLSCAPEIDFETSARDIGRLRLSSFANTGSHAATCT